MLYILTAETSSSDCILGYTGVVAVLADVGGSDGGIIQVVAEMAGIGRGVSGDGVIASLAVVDGTVAACS